MAAIRETHDAAFAPSCARPWRVSRGTRPRGPAARCAGSRRRCKACRRRSTSSPTTAATSGRDADAPRGRGSEPWRAAAAASRRALGVRVGVLNGTKSQYRSLGGHLAEARLCSLPAPRSSRPAASLTAGRSASHVLFASNRTATATRTRPTGGTPLRRPDRRLGGRAELRRIARRPSPRLSPQPQRAVYVADGAGRHLRKVGEGFRRLVSRRVAARLLTLEGAEAAGLRVVNADGTGARTLVAGGGSFTEFEGWSADGQELAFTLEAWTRRP